MQAKPKIYYEAHLDWLNPDTPYMAWLTIPSHSKASSGVTFPPVYFHTKKKNPKCFLARDFNTCRNVYYSVYIPDSKLDTSTVPTSELGYVKWTSNFISQRSDFVNRHYDAFLKALRQYDCKAHPFSPVRNCDDCRVSYKNWLCAIAFPKCGQRPQHITDFIRTPYFDNLEGDLLTIKPCAFLCHYVIQDCPSMLKFRCPVVDDTYEKYFPTKNEIWSWAEYELQFRKHPFSSNTTPPIQKMPFCNAMLSSLRIPNSEYVFKSSSQLSPAISILPLLVILTYLHV
ncbi:stretch-activated cation channel mid1 [Entomophthora muscae]|uniref:Stretch-activated cation channel mid1 n=1 Tax=Entomophthora muscae TaxID=34485 RepID=A0ACC2S0E7_9FUNG|nr:stretch-activated cation channel mid1 [Entomophthora muscae]